MKKIQLLSFVAALAAAGGASANEAGCFYLKGDLGYNLSHGKVKLKSQKYAPAPSVRNPSVATDNPVNGASSNSGNFNGPAIAAGVGYSVTDEFRTDLVFDYRFKQKKNFNFPAKAYLDPANGDPTAAAQDNVEVSNKSWLLMANLYYDFNNTSDWTPFVNAGLGYGSSKIHTALIDSLKNNISSKKGFAWGVGAGVAYKFSSNMHADLSYNLTGMKNEATLKNQATIDAGATTAVISAELPYISHSVSLGLRVGF